MNYLHILIVSALLWVGAMEALNALGFPEVANSYFLLFAIGGVVWGAFYHFSNKAIVLRGLNASPKKIIGEFAEGEPGRIVGNIIFGKKVLLAPLSKRRCAYYRAKVEEYGSKNEWYGRINIQEFGDIIVCDDVHYALIDTSNIICHAAADYKASCGLGHNAPKEFEEFLSANAMTSTGLLKSNKTLRCEESVIRENEKICVSGRGSWVDVVQLGLDLPVERILVIKPGDDGFVYMTTNDETA